MLQLGKPVNTSVALCSAPGFPPMNGSRLDNSALSSIIQLAVLMDAVDRSKTGGDRGSSALGVPAKDGSVVAQRLHSNNVCVGIRSSGEQPMSDFGIDPVVQGPFPKGTGDVAEEDTSSLCTVHPTLAPFTEVTLPECCFVSSAKTTLISVGRDM